MLEGPFPIVLSFDIDGETLWLNRDPKNADRPVVLSQGRYGPTRGVPRLMEILERHEIKATFFVPGWIAQQYPDMVRKLHSSGHEVANHGFLHEWPSKLDNERAEEAALLRGSEAIAQAIGTMPVGYRAPGWEFSQFTLKLLAKHGFRYSSNMMDDDRPYLHPVASDGHRIVELPVSWMLDDTAFALYSLQLPSAKQWPSSTMYEMWTGEFDVLQREGDLFVLTLHPQVSGRPYRAQLLDRFIHYVKEHAEVRFLRAVDMADEVLASR